MMVNNKNNMDLLKEILSYVFLILFTSITVIFTLKLWNKDLSVPFSYSIDAFGPLKEVKNLILGNGLYEMPQLAAPLGGTEQFTIKGFIWHFFILKILTLFLDEPGLVINLYYLLGFPLTAVTAFWVARKCRIDRFIAMAISIAYCLLPYHFYKGTFHIFYASYYLIPLACLVIIALFFQNNSNIRIFKNKKNTIIYSVIISLLIGLSDTYYGAFFCILLLFTGIVGAFYNKKVKCLIQSIIYIILTGIAIIGAIAPTWLYTFFYGGSNVFSSERSIYDIELYSLKLSHLILPMHGHRIDFLNNIRIAYDQNSIAAHESSYTALGLIMALGLLFSIFCVFIRVKNRNEAAIVFCGKINLFILLLCSIGGFNVLIGMFLTTSIRSYARIVVYLAFFSVLSVAFILNDICSLIACKWKHMAPVGISVILICIAVWDQTSPNFAQLGYYEVFSNSINRPYEETKVMYESDRKFVEEIEENVSEGAMVLQLPIVSDSIYDVFPSGKTGAYGVVRPFLHSSGKIRWSQGAQKGDQNDRWLKVLQTYQYQDIIKIASIVGFSGVYIDTSGFNENDLNIVLSYLDEITEVEPIISDLGDLYYYDLKNYNNMMKTNLAEGIEESKELLLQIGRLDNYYTIEGKNLNYLGDYYAINNGMLMGKGSLQFGPYIDLAAGTYKISVYGANLSEVQVSAYTNGDSINCLLDINDLVCTQNKITYYINSDHALEKLECSIQCDNNTVISKYEIEKIDNQKLELSELSEKVQEILKNVDSKKDK